jgi:hypothetical protein
MLLKSGSGGWVIPLSTRAIRWLHGALAGLLSLGLLVCVGLDPDPRGRGTHRQLGLPPCLISRLLGVERCPSCGLTTAICYAMQGKMAEARRIHPAAPVVLGIWLSLAVFFTAMAVSGRNWLWAELLGMGLLSGAALVAWLIAFWRLLT